MARKHKGEPEPQPQPPAPGPILWQNIPTECTNCGARVDIAAEIRSPRPACRFCAEPLPCEPVPPPQPPAPGLQIPGVEGPFAGLVNAAMQHSMNQANQFFAPGGAAQMFAANQMMSGGMAYDPTAHLAQDGQPGTATVTTWSDLGVDTGHGRLFNVSLSVNRADGGSYPTMAKTVIPPDVGPRLTQGMTVGVRLDPADPYSVHVMWSEI
jgi:hypothetical protein